MKVDYNRGLIFWKRKAYPLSEVKDLILKDHSDKIGLYQIYAGVKKNGNIERKYAWDSVFHDLHKDGTLEKVIGNISGN